MTEPQLVSNELCKQRYNTIVKDVETNTTDIKKLAEVSVRLATIIEMKEKQESKESPLGDFWNTKAGIMILRVIIVSFVVLLGISIGVNVLPMI